VDHYFYRYEIAPAAGRLLAMQEPRVVVIVDATEGRARSRLLQMYPKVEVLQVRRTLFEAMPARRSSAPVKLRSQTI